MEENYQALIRLLVKNQAVIIDMLQACQKLLRESQEMARRSLAAMAHHSTQVIEAKDALGNPINDYSTDSIPGIPLYKGKRDRTTVCAFISLLKLRFAIKRITNDEAKIIQFGCHLTGQALLWFQSYVGGNYGSFSYEKVIEEFKGRFLPLSYEEAREQLKPIQNASRIRSFRKIKRQC